MNRRCNDRAATRAGNRPGGRLARDGRQVVMAIVVALGGADSASSSATGVTVTVGLETFFGTPVLVVVGFLALPLRTLDAVEFIARGSDEGTGLPGGKNLS